MNDDEIKKDQDFLTQIPDWEKGYKDSDEQQIKFEKEKWKTAPATFTEHDIIIFGHAVMEDWETPYMEELAAIATSRGGAVLELGYGMGISARFIQQHDIEKHVVMEANEDILEKAKEFAQTAPHETVILSGLWEDTIEQIPDNSLDGILFDTYPLTEKELYQNHFNFFPFAYRKLKKGGVFTYYSDEIQDFSDVHIRKLKEAGFDEVNITRKVVPIEPPEDCEYWQAKTILAPIIIK
jgi:guanidinoacetate N-methyltransferase